VALGATARVRILSGKTDYRWDSGNCENIGVICLATYRCWWPETYFSPVIFVTPIFF